MIRNGRVDLHIEFADATAEQVRGLFAQFYKAAPAQLASDFETALRAKLGERTVSMAALQSFFVNMRKASPEEAVGSVGKILNEMEERAKATEATERAEAEGKKKEGEESKDKDKAAEAGTAQKHGKTNKDASASEGETHIHVHVHK